MNVRDLLSMSTDNLWRMKLRAFLTISGVVIAIAAFVSMVSFGAGMQENISEQFNQLGLLTTVQVYPLRENEVSDTAKAAILDDSAVTRMANLPGVRLAYPFDDFSVTATLLDTSVTAKAQALPEAAVRTKLFSGLKAGTAFTGDSTHEVLVTSDFLKDINVSDPDSIIGKPIVLAVDVSVLDSGLVQVFTDKDHSVKNRLEAIDIDSLVNLAYLRQVALREVTAAAQRFASGYLNHRATVTDTLTISGVLESERHGRRLRTESILVPLATARRLTGAGFSGDPIELMSSLVDGTIFNQPGQTAGKSYPRVTLDMDPAASYEPVKDSIEAMGFRSFSFAAQFDQMRKVFVYMDMALGLIGLIALVTASLGIVNTLVMSILERRKEIGVLKSLGADERDIRRLFLVESAVIGSVGAIVGITFGWIITRIVSAVAKAMMAREGVTGIELFALPWWLILIAFSFGLIVSLIAGLYPAARAARVDPVEALRNE